MVFLCTFLKYCCQLLEGKDCVLIQGWLSAFTIVPRNKCLGNTGRNHLELELGLDTVLTLNIFLYPPVFNVMWMIWACLVTHLLLNRICRICYPFWSVGSQDIHRTTTDIKNLLHRACHWLWTWCKINSWCDAKCFVF